MLFPIPNFIYYGDSIAYDLLKDFMIEIAKT